MTPAAMLTRQQQRQPQRRQRSRPALPVLLLGLLLAWCLVGLSAAFIMPAPGKLNPMQQRAPAAR